MSFLKNGPKEQRDSSLNHFVTGDKVVQTCVFKLDFSHLPSQAEQMGIDFVTETKKQTDAKQSGAGKAVFAKRMYYYMVLVLDPEFSAEETRTAKEYSIYTKTARAARAASCSCSENCQRQLRGGGGGAGPRSKARRKKNLN